MDGTITDAAGVELATGDLLPEPVALRSWHQTASWTEERTERMKVLLGEGLSCSMIATDLGGGLTRNAVIGKISRMGLRTPGKRIPTVCKPAYTSAGRKRKRRIQVAPIEFVPTPEPTEATDIAVEFVPENPMRLLDLQDAHCRFPLGEPREMMFCGGLIAVGSYCIGHRRLCYQQSRAK